MELTAFSFGFEGWGPHTPALIRAFDAVEESRGFAPPVLVDIRASRVGGAVGFRGNALEVLLGERYIWLPELGHVSYVSDEVGTFLAEPDATAQLLDWILEYTRQNRRVVFFCSCASIRGCHREYVAAFLLMEASRRRIVLEVAEWPGGEPRTLEVRVPEDVLSKVPRGRKSVPLPDEDPLWFGTPWYSLAILRSGDSEQHVLTGPARRGRQWALPILEWDEDAELLPELVDAYRKIGRVEPRSSRIVGELPVHPFCITHSLPAHILSAIATQRDGTSILNDSGDWTSVAKQLQEAALAQEHLLMLMKGEDEIDIGWVAQVDWVRLPEGLDERTRATFRLSNLRKLKREQWFPHSDLRLKGTGEPLAEGERPGHVVCHTPKFLMRRHITLLSPYKPMRGWLARVYGGDFSSMPEQITFDEFMDLHVVIDGYHLGEELGYGKGGGLAALTHEKRGEFERTGQWRGTVLELWLCLFFVGRQTHWGSPPPEREWRSLYGALRQALQVLSDEDPNFEPARGNPGA